MRFSGIENNYIKNVSHRESSLFAYDPKISLFLNHLPIMKNGFRVYKLTNKFFKTNLKGIYLKRIKTILTLKYSGN